VLPLAFSKGHGVAIQQRELGAGMVQAFGLRKNIAPNNTSAARGLLAIAAFLDNFSEPA
jgi:hypothetical protein